MIILTIDEIILLHEKLIIETGGSHGVRDIALLESAVYSANSEFDEIETYPTVSEKAARLAFSLIKNHAFIDGNKRIGILVMLLTLRLNSINPVYSQEELINLGLSVADSSLNYTDILNWIKCH